MNINNFIGTLNTIFSEQDIEINLNPNDYELAIIENIPNTEICRWTNAEINSAIQNDGILSPNTTSRRGTPPNGNSATHFFISSNSRRMFTPFVSQELDPKYSITYPFKVFEPNLKLMLNYLPNGYYSNERVEVLNTEFSDVNCFDVNLSVKATGNRIMFSSKSLVTPVSINRFYKELRYSLFEGDYLVILKRKQEFNYVTLFLPEAIVQNHFENIDTLDGQLIGDINGTGRPYELQNLLITEPGKNILIFGAPGTGKSYYIKENFEHDSESVRVVFHEEYSYQDFIGGIKPTISQGQPLYIFSPGPFTRVLKKALNNPMEKYTLIIEELNRANAASVFGDIFQLLDRDENGVSEYSIENNEILSYVNEQNQTIHSEIRLPRNLNIVATMNSADQGVFPLDTAFKRRWQFEYIPIEFDTWHSSTLIQIFADTTHAYEISIQNFIESINDYLSNLDGLDINEDRLIGPYFLKEFEWLSWENEESYKKIFSYLWEDVARLDRYSLFKNNFSQFSHICAAFRSSNQVFVDQLHQVLLNKSIQRVL